MDLNDRVWHDTKSGAAYAGVHPDTLLDALQSGECRGHQRVSPGGKWRIRREWLDAWMGGEAA